MRKGTKLTRTQIIQLLVDFCNYQRYLEIGIFNGENFRQINIPYKAGVDPDPNCRASYQMTSDQFFSSNTERFDIIFLDGLHHADQFERDVLNSLDCLADNGTIVAHDLSPRSCESQEIPRRVKQWNGDVWKGWMKLRTKRNDLEMIAFNCDEGTGIIRKGSQEKLKLKIKHLTYENLCKHRDEWLNLKPAEFFIKFLRGIAE